MREREGYGQEPEQFRKLFIGGLNYKTTDNGLRDYYTQWGNLTDSVVMKDGQTGKSRGFGFVTFGTTAMVDAAMRARPHEIDGRQVQPKRAVPREDTNSPGSNLSVNKIFIAGLRGKPIKKEDLKEYFAAFGNVKDCQVLTDDVGNNKGFAVVAFDEYDPVDKVVLQKYHTIFNVPLEVKKAAGREHVPRRESRGGRGGINSGTRNQNSNFNEDEGGQMGFGHSDGRNNFTDSMNERGNMGQAMGGNMCGTGGNFNGQMRGRGNFGNFGRNFNDGNFAGNNFGENYGQNFSGGAMRNNGKRPYGEDRPGPYNDAPFRN